MSKSKNDIFYLIVLILTIITLMVGITFTYFSLVAKEKDDSTKVKTGSIAINYIGAVYYRHRDEPFYGH